MNVVIIEDEKLTAEDLKQMIGLADASIQVTAVLHSVEEGLRYFKTHSLPDLVFSDIQLGDGLSFEIVEHLGIPVIFCTAFDEYALSAFKANGIDYILKPFSVAAIKAALHKLKNLSSLSFRQNEISAQYESIKQMLANSRATKASSLLIQFKDKIIPLKIDEIAIFFLENNLVSLMNFDKSLYYPGKTLDELEQIAGDDFFRVNRQYLVNRKAIINVSSLFSRKLSLNLSIPLKEGITISREKAPIFLKWLSG